MKQKAIMPSQILIKAAEQLVKKIESPGVFLKYLNDILHWLHLYFISQEKRRQEDDHHFTVIVIIENIVIPWYGGGPNMIINIAEGLKEVISYCGDDGLRALINQIIVAHGQYSEGVDYTSKGISEHNTMMEALTDLLIAAEENESSESHINRKKEESVLN
jgi:hypothetical protein